MFRKILFLLLVLSLLVSPLSASGNRWTSKPPLGSQIDWQHPLSKGLVAVWLMNEKGGIKINNLASKNIGTFNGEVLWKPDSTYYPGTQNVRITIPNSPNIDFGANQDFSVVTMISSTQSAVSGTWPMIINKEDSLGTRVGYSIFLHNSTNTNWFFEIYVAGTAYSVSGRTNVADGKKHLLAGTRKGSNLLSYEDGIYGSLLSASAGSVKKDIVLSFGSIDQLWSTYLGYIYFVYIYNRALSSQEIQTLYQDPYCFIKPPTIWSNFKTAVEAVRRVIFIE